MNINNSKNILIITPNRLGDTIFCTPFIRLLKTSFPHMQIDILAPTALSAEVFKNSPQVAQVLLAPKIEELSAKKDFYDLTIRAGDSEYAAQCMAVLNAEKIDISARRDPTLPAADNYLHYFAKLFTLDLSGFSRHYDLYPNEENNKKIINLLEQNQINLKQHKLVGFHIGCHSLAKKRTRFWQKQKHSRAWLVDNFIALAQALVKSNSNVRIVITGSEAEEKLGLIFSKKISKNVNLINKTSILDIAALVRHLDAFIIGDTGIMHAACCSNVNLIVLQGLDNPIINDPYPEAENRVVLKANKINDISVEEVLRCLVNFLKQ
jgi:ADP-heptose:LPS heptosyltransferase